MENKNQNLPGSNPTVITPVSGSVSSTSVPESQAAPAQNGQTNSSPTQTPFQSSQAPSPAGSGDTLSQLASPGSLESSNNPQTSDTVPNSSYTVPETPVPPSNLRPEGQHKRRVTKALTLISAGALAIVLLVAGLSAFIIRRNNAKLQTPTDAISEQDVNIGLAAQGLGVLGLQDGRKLIINGDVVTRGSVYIGTAEGNYFGQLDASRLTANRQYFLPDESGEICLSTNNCADDLEVPLQADVAIQTAAGGVTTINGQTGDVTVTIGSGESAQSLTLLQGTGITLETAQNDNGVQIQISTTAFLQGGNTYGETAVLGTNDSSALQIRTNGTTRATFASNGTFTVQNASSTPLFRVDVPSALVWTESLRPLTAGQLTTTVYRASLGSVPTMNRTGQYNSLVLNSSGLARIFHFKATISDLMYTSCNNLLCDAPTTQTLVSAGNPSRPSAATAPNGNMHVAYYFGSANEVRYFQCNSDCSIQTPAAGSHTAVATGINSMDNRGGVSVSVGSDNLARIVVDNGSGSTGVTFIRCTNSTCSTKVTTTFDNGFPANSPTIALASDNTARIFYNRGGGVGVAGARYIQCLNNDCSSGSPITVDTSSTAGENGSIALDSNNLARIVYRGSSNRLNYINCLNSACTTKNGPTVLDSAVSIQSATIGVDSEDGVQIAYYTNNSSGQDLKHITCNTDSCSSVSIVTIDSTGNVGRDPSIAIGTDGSAQIAYGFVSNTTGDDCEDCDSARLKFANTGSRTDTITGSNIGTSSSKYANLHAITVNTERFTLTPSSDNTNVFQVKNAAGQSILLVDSTNKRVGIGPVAAGATLTVGGEQPAIKGGNGKNADTSLQVLGTKGGDTAGTTGQTAGKGSGVILQAGAGGDANTGSTNGAGGTVLLQGGAAGSGTGTAGTAGYVLVKNAQDSEGAFQVQNAAGVAVFNVDTVDGSETFLRRGGATFYLPNLGAGNYTLCTTATCSGGGGGGSSILNQTTLQTAANFYIQSGATDDVTAAIQALTGQTADLLQLQDDSSNPITGFTADGYLYINSAGLSGAAERLRVNTPTVADAAATVIITNESEANKALVLQGASAAGGQILFELQNDGGSPLLQMVALTDADAAFLGTSSAMQILWDNNSGYWLGFGAQPLTAVRSILLPDESGVVCLQNSSDCGFASSSGTGSFINDDTVLQTNANFNIQTGAVGDITAVIRALGGQTADLLQIQNSSGTALSGVNASGNYYFANSGFRLTLAASSLSNNVSITFPNASGTVCLTSGNCAGIGGTGDILQGGNSFGTTVTLGSNDSNNLALETNNTVRATFDTSNNLYLGNGTTNASPPISFTIQGTGGSGTDIAGTTVNIAGGRGTGSAVGGSINFQTSAAGSSSTTLRSLSTVFSLQGGTGQAIFQNLTDSTTAFRVRNAAGSTTVLGVDTSNTRVGIGNAAPDATLEVTGDVYLSNGANRTIKLEDSTSGAGHVLAINGSNAQTSASTATAGGNVVLQAGKGGQSGIGATVSGPDIGAKITLTGGANNPGAGAGDIILSPGYQRAACFGSCAYDAGNTYIQGSGTKIGGSTSTQPTAKLQIAGPGSYWSGGPTFASSHILQLTNAAETIAYVTVASNGNMGIGTAAPAAQLHVATYPSSSISSIGNISSLNDLTEGVVVGRYAYMTQAGSNDLLRIVDVSRPTNPVSVSTTSLTSDPASVAVSGHYAYTVSNNASGGSNALQVIDVSNPAAPVVVASMTPTISPGGIEVRGGYAYLIPRTNASFSQIEAIDIRNPYNPVSAGTLTLSNQITDLFIHNNYAYVTSAGSNDVLWVVDISNPTGMRAMTVSGRSTGNNPAGVYVQNKYAYVVTSSSTTMQIFDVSDPTSTAGSVSNTTINGTGVEVWVQGRYVYAAKNGSDVSFDVIDAGNPASPVNNGSVPSPSPVTSSAGMIQVQGRYAYQFFSGSSIAASLHVFDLGGAYIQQLSIGGMETGTFSASNDASFSANVNIQGGLVVGQGLNIQGRTSNSYFSNTVITTTTTTETANQITLQDSGTSVSLSSGTDNSIGQSISVTRTSNGDGTVTLNNYGQNIAVAGTFSGGTTATMNNYGINIAVTGNTNSISNNYGIQIAATGADTNYGVVIQGMSGASDQAVWLSSTANNTNAANGIAFGSSKDTNLYRSGTDLLRTDDSFIAGTKLQVGTGSTIDQCAFLLGNFDCDAFLEVAGISTTTNSAYGIYNNFFATPSGNNSNLIAAYSGSSLVIGTGLNFSDIYGSSNFVTVANSGTNTKVTGILSNATVTAGTTTNLIALQGSVGLEANAITTTVTNGYGLLISSTSASAINGGTATLTNNYGIRIENQTAGTNDYGVYIGGADTYALWVDSGVARFDGQVTIGESDTTGVLLVLDTKTDSGDPSGTNGAMYYNSNAGKFRCYEGGSWKDCISGSGSSLFTDAGDYTHLTSTTDELTIGSSADIGGKLNIVGTADQSQVVIRSHSTQTNPLGLFQNNSGSELARLVIAEGGSAGHNIGLGLNVLSSLGSGEGNIAFGTWALQNTTDGTANVGIGSGALNNNQTGTSNIALGAWAQQFRTEGDNNIAIGESALRDDLNGDYSVAIGAWALQNNATGGSNIAIGRGAMNNSEGGNTNIALGVGALYSSEGSNNIAIGYQAGDNITSGSNNIIIGHNVDADSATGDNQLNIGGLITSPDYTTGAVWNGLMIVSADVGSNYAASFVNGGDNQNRYGIVIQGGANDGSGTTYYLDARDGDGTQVGYIANVSGTFGLTDVSDRRTKTNITDTEVGGLSVINGLHVVDFNRIGSPDGPRITGFIAQDVQDVYSQAVTVGPDGMLGLNKDAFIPVLVKGVQEQQGQLGTIQQRVAALEQAVNGINTGGQQTNMFNTLNVSGNTSTASLSVSGAANIGTLTVAGNVTVGGNLRVNGHIIGNDDTRGTITVEQGEDEFEYEFIKPYQTNTKPVVILTPVNEFTPSYRVESDEDSFTVYFAEPLSKDTKINYQVQQ